MRWLPLLVALAGCGDRGTRATGPAKIDVACALLPDGATCDFVNVGGPATRCVRALYAVRSSGTVVTSDELCSGRLAPKGKLTVATRFARRPVDVCGDRPAEACAVKVVDAANAETAAGEWQQQLFQDLDGGMSQRRGPLDRSECRRLAEHVYQLRYDEEMAYMQTPQDKEEARRYMMEERSMIIEDWMSTCVNEMERPVASCMMHARKFEDVDACWDAGAE